MDKILSQDEVDALLKGISDGEIETETAISLDPSNVKSYDLTSRDRIVSGKMPTMEIVNERFARAASISLCRFIGKVAETRVESFQLIKYSEFIEKLPVPASLNLFRTVPFRGTSLFFFDAALIFFMVDILFGGKGKMHMKVEGRDFTPIEQRIIIRLIEILFKDLQTAWSLIENIGFQYVRSELNPQFATIVAPTDIVLATTFSLELEWVQGRMGYCIPYSTIEPVKDRLYGRVQSEYPETDRNWSERIAGHLNDISLEIVVEAGTTEMVLRDLISLKVGDVIRLNNGPNDPMLFKIQDRPKGLCVPGQQNGSYAVEVRSIWNSKTKEETHGRGTPDRQGGPARKG
jgi:flagellar motor switch protein FliM